MDLFCIYYRYKPIICIILFEVEFSKGWSICISDGFFYLFLPSSETHWTFPLERILAFKVVSSVRFQSVNVAQGFSFKVETLNY